MSSLICTAEDSDVNDDINKVAFNINSRHPSPHQIKRLSFFATAEQSLSKGAAQTGAGGIY